MVDVSDFETFVFKEVIMCLITYRFEKQQIYKPYLVAQTVEEMAEHLLILKSFFVFPYDNHEPFNATVIGGLDEIFTFMFNNTNYPIREYLKQLAPDCNSLVVGGSIYDAYINTSEYFEKRMTSSSTCCMFNYNRRSYGIDGHSVNNDFVNKAEKIKFESSSILNAVQFVLQSDPADFTVTEFQTQAFQLYIFHPEDYPTIQSNRIGEILVDYSTIVEVPIEIQYFSSSNQVRQFAPDVRNCYFPDEGQKLLNLSFYSIDECLLLCRMDSMLRHCGCVAPPMAATSKNIIQCNFVDLPCLMKWKPIWYGWDDFEYVHSNDEDKEEHSIRDQRCPLCLPSCNGVDYYLDVNVKRLYKNLGPLYNYGIL